MITKEDIAEGIYLGISRERAEVFKGVLRSIVFAGGLFLLIIIILGGIGKYQEYHFCGSWNCYNNIPVAPQIQCNYPLVYCWASDLSYEPGTLVGYKEACGYEEAEIMIKFWKEQLTIIDGYKNIQIICK